MMGRPWLRILPTLACSVTTAAPQFYVKTATALLPADQLRGALYGERRVPFPHNRGRRSPCPKQTDLVRANPRVNARACLAIMLSLTRCGRQHLVVNATLWILTVWSSSLSMGPNQFHSCSGLQLTRGYDPFGRKENGDAVVA